MAVTEKEKKAVQSYFDTAKKEDRLDLVEVQDIDVLYPYTDWPCVLRVPTEQGIELWACELTATDVDETDEVPAHQTFEVAGAILVGSQDQYGNNHWLPGVK